MTRLFSDEKRARLIDEIIEKMDYPKRIEKTIKRILKEESAGGKKELADYLRRNFLEIVRGVFRKQPDAWLDSFHALVTGERGGEIVKYFLYPFAVIDAQITESTKNFLEHYYGAQDEDMKPLH